MASEVAERFMGALRELEESGDTEPLMALFSDEPEAANLGRAQPAHGREEVRRFWQDYLNAFDGIRSEFTHVIEGEGGAVLEWVSRGKLPNGEPVEYRGVSVLELEGNRVRRFRSYYDSAVFLPEGAKTRG
jgi:ketosteroid isomerase-like protein